MNHTLRARALFLCAALAATGCNKSANNYSTTDHTVGMLASRHWTGTSAGRTPGTATVAGTVYTNWPVSFSRTIGDTTFAVAKFDGFTVKVGALTLAWRATDSTAGYVRYDTVLSGSAVSTLMYYYASNSMTLDYHRIDSFHAATGSYYETNTSLHTTP